MTGGKFNKLIRVCLGGAGFGWTIRKDELYRKKILSPAKRLGIENGGKRKADLDFTLFRKTGRIKIGIRHTNRHEIIGKRPV